MDNPYHFIGIGGIGMSALARILLEKKISVSGSDQARSATVEQLVSSGAHVAHGHAPGNVDAKQTIVYSSGIKENNPEWKAAKELGCSMLHRSELLARLMEGHRTFATAGTHGKTTTSALLSAVLLGGGYDPTFAVGGMVEGRNGRVGSSPFFVAEADESDGTFLNYHPEGAIITNVEPEHMEHYKTEENLKKTFQQFITQVGDHSLLFMCGDDPFLAAQGKGVTYGFGERCALRLMSYRQVGWEGTFDFTFEGKRYSDVAVALTGRHNALNAAAVFGLALKLGVDEAAIRHALKTFAGIGRRCQKRGEKDGVLLLDDYAHHPTEIEKTLAGVKEAIGERRLLVLFQPHRYTRTRDTLEGYNSAFQAADQVYITDIYAAGEEAIDGITAESVIDRVKSVPCAHADTLVLRPHDVLITVGAGDITHFHHAVPAPKKWRVALIFGGQGCEHEISLRSAAFVNSSLNPALYEMSYFGIDKSGGWVKMDGVESPENGGALSTVLPELERCEIILPIMHGARCEDGTMQGLFEVLGKPYVGPNYRAAAIAMDKALCKKVVAAAGVRVPKDVTYSRESWGEGKGVELDFPLYVKPVHLGSSVGVSFVQTEEELVHAMSCAFAHDTHVMIEEAKLHCRELEFAVLGGVVPPPGEKLAGGEFVDYAKKYGKEPVQTRVETELSADLIEKGRACAKRAYEAVGCSGMTRVDFLLDEAGTFWFFEMNPIPGLQPLSLFPKIWKREGLDGNALIDRLVVLALHRHRVSCFASF